MRSSLGTTEHVRGTSPFYMIELLRSHHVWALWLFWASCFGAFSYLLFHSDDMQYHCYSFCNTTSLRPCSLLSASNGSDISWNSMGSNCFNPSESANWTSAGSVTMSSSSSIQAVDVVPDMRAVGRRYSRFVLRFLDGEYTYVSSSLFANTSFAPRVKSLVVAQIDASSSVGDELVPLATPVVLESKAFSNIFTSGDSDIVFELPIGYRFPEGTQQLVIEFPGGPPLVPLVGNATVNTSSVQLTFATSSPTYLMYEVLARYVLLGATCVVVLLVLCLHALADTAVYDVFHPSVPSFDRWLACFSAVSFVTERESLLWDVWPRQPMFVKSVLISLAIMTLLCDPLVGAFYAFPENVVLQFWSMNLMPWLRFSWMVLTSSWLLACLMTCGDRGRMYAAASSIIPSSIMKMANATTETTEIQGGSSASVVPLPASLIEPHSGEERSTILSAAFKSRLFLILLALGPPAFYFGSVVAAGRDGDPSQPSAVGRGHGKGMIGSVIAVEIYPPTLLFLVWYYAQRSLYARYPKGVADASPYPPAFGVPSVKGNGRAFVIAVRFLLPFCVWASVYMSATYFGTLQGLSKLLPSYDNGHLVEVLLNVLIGWTIAIIVVPVRKSMQLFPPRPSVYPPPTLPSDDAAAASDDVAMTDVSGVSSSVPKYSCGARSRGPLRTFNACCRVMPNCGYAFRTEAHEIAFHRIQSTVVEPPPPKPKIRRTFVVGQRRLAITAIKTIPAVRRSFFCWETAVRCLNMSNEAYLDVSGDVDLSYYAAAEPYEHSCCESCIETGCCCFWPTFMGGGCAPIDVGDDRDVIPGDAGEGGHGGDEDEGHLPMSQSNRRFTEAGAVAEDASRLSDKNFFHRIRTQDELTSYVHQQDGGEDQDASTTRPSSVAAQPRLAIRAESPSTPPPPSQAGDVIPSISCQSLNSDTPILAKSSAPPGQPRNSNNTPSLQNSVAVTPRSAMDVVLFKRQINVMRYGYQLVKVMDVYGVRILIAATPRGTTGRYPHLCIAFRGTVNLRNALTNVNASMSPYAEMNDKHAEAHSGFLLAFEQLLPTLISALNSFYFYESDDGFPPVTDSHRWVTSWAQGLSRVICTGHSLGGGLAMLCAYSIAKGRLHQEIFSKLAARSTSTPSTPAARAPSSSSTSGGGGALDSIQLRCYTYGSPSFSNSRFVDLFNDAVPETYRVVNENDIIPHVGFCWHAHAGREVRVNRDGDAIVEGTFLEKHYASLLQGVGSRFKNHLLARYGNSLDNCLCSRNLAVLSPDCCSCVMVHVE
ncbi:membrane-bound triacylglycerol lipase, putative [Bodo saltans]|uniref:Membrane-bound triacylglycerol lipase, putative n=1 Tax=Bodo saltans TaxID=75058 RepID=A0A0S4JUH5_BODSA|nr:membrane-bound triacylglycerol lipase, putative [Bodo saltans]|eukprot:CUG92753.1 membrane-bound triacylglycerol lipase, putative [Bodo saltans]